MKTYSVRIKVVQTIAGNAVFFALLIFAIFLIPTKWSYYGVMSMPFLLHWLTASDGMEIDMQNNRYRTLLIFFYLIRVGKWKQLPLIERLDLYPITYFDSAGSREPTGYFQEKVYGIKMIGIVSQKAIFVGRFYSFSKAKKELEALSKVLNVDYTVKLRKEDVLRKG